MPVHYIFKVNQTSVSLRGELCVVVLLLLDWLI